MSSFWTGIELEADGCQVSPSLSLYQFVVYDADQIHIPFCKVWLARSRAVVLVDISFLSDARIGKDSINSSLLSINLLE